MCRRHALTNHWLNVNDTYCVHKLILVYRRPLQDRQLTKAKITWHTNICCSNSLWPFRLTDYRRRGNQAHFKCVSLWVTSARKWLQSCFPKFQLYEDKLLQVWTNIHSYQKCLMSLNILIFMNFSNIFVCVCHHVTSNLFLLYIVMIVLLHH